MKFDHYRTPEIIVDSLLQSGFMNGAATLLEPCAGQGAIIETVLKWHPETEVSACEILKQEFDILVNLPVAAKLGNFFDWKVYRRFDRVICNPPFSNYHEFFRRCFELTNDDGKLAFFIRTPMLSGKGHCEFYKEYKPSQIILLSDRPCFLGNNYDISGYCWVIWDKPSTDHDTIVTWV